MPSEALNWIRIKYRNYFTPRKMWSFYRRHGFRSSLARSVPFIRQCYHELGFDWRYAVKTRHILPADTLGAVGPNAEFAYRYRPSHVYSVMQALTLLASHVPNMESETLIDYGCGAGRVMLLAAEAGFGKVIGIEFSPYMATICRSNLTSYHRRRPGNTEFAVYDGDAAEFDPPDDAHVFFFYSPFKWNIYEKVLTKIEESLKRRPREIFILEVTPRNRANFASKGYRTIDSFDDKTGEIVDIYANPPPTGHQRGGMRSSLGNTSGVITTSPSTNPNHEPIHWQTDPLKKR